MQKVVGVHGLVWIKIDDRLDPIQKIELRNVS